MRRKYRIPEPLYFYRIVCTPIVHSIGVDSTDWISSAIGIWTYRIIFLRQRIGCHKPHNSRIHIPGYIIICIIPMHFNELFSVVFTVLGVSSHSFCPRQTTGVILNALYSGGRDYYSSIVFVCGTPYLPVITQMVFTVIMVIGWGGSRVHPCSIAYGIEDFSQHIYSRITTIKVVLYIINVKCAGFVYHIKIPFPLAGFSDRYDYGGGKCEIPGT